MEQTLGTPKLNEALAKFQQKHHAAGKDGKANYGFYTTLAGGLAAAQPATEFGLSHTQTFNSICEGDKVVTTLITTLRHVSGEEVQSELAFPELVPNRGNIMQALGSAITYARRYALLAIYGLAGDDDDAEGSVRPPIPAKKAGITRTPTKSDNAKALTTEPAKTVEQVDWIDTDRKTRIVDALRKLEGPQKTHVLSEFKEGSQISASSITPDHITTSKHGHLLENLLGLDPYVPTP